MDHLKIAGRNHEINLLKELGSSQNSEFLAIYGRRRIGKTYLINTYFESSSVFFNYTGVRKLTAKMQIKKFNDSLNNYFDVKNSTPENWIEALTLLQNIIKKNNAPKKIIFLDELPWIAGRKSGFLEALDDFWNSFASKRKDVILIICGSAASWMIDNVINNKSGLHNRVTRIIPMLPFNLKETHLYFKMKKIDLTQQQILEIYMATGGVAHYLNLISRGQSSNQFIDKEFFKKNGFLFSEYKNLFASLFEKYEIHHSIVKLLSSSAHGLSYIDLADKLKIKTGGSLTKTLNELVHAGFIEYLFHYGNKKKLGVYRLSDEYCKFYLTWVEPLGHNIPENYWQLQIGKPKYNSWIGNTFESICIKNASKIIKALGLSGISTSISTVRTAECQIDLVIERSDNVNHICEMKYSNEPYKLTQAESTKIEKRKNIFSHLTKNKQIFVTLISPKKVIKNKYYLEQIHNEVNLKNLF